MHKSLCMSFCAWKIIHAQSYIQDKPYMKFLIQHLFTIRKIPSEKSYMGYHIRCPIYEKLYMQE